MTDVLSLLWPAFVVAICLVGIHTYFGIEVLRRKVIFVDLSLAQIAALGASVAFLLGHPVQSAAAYGYSLPIMSAILCLLAIVVLSYRQTIRAYPKGGGSYIVASDNLGPLAGLVAGCSLITSYTLTVAVSVASSVDAIVSAAAPGCARNHPTNTPRRGPFRSHLISTSDSIYLPAMKLRP